MAYDGRDDYKAAAAALEQGIDAERERGDGWATEAEDMQEEIDTLRAEIARLREGVECHVARPGEGTYECRHDAPCPACRLRAAEGEVDRLRVERDALRTALANEHEARLAMEQGDECEPETNAKKLREAAEVERLRGERDLWKGRFEIEQAGWDGAFTDIARAVKVLLRVRKLAQECGWSIDDPDPVIYGDDAVGIDDVLSILRGMKGLRRDRQG